MDETITRNKEVKFPRCFLDEPSSYNNYTIELHTVDDESEEAYVAASYIRVMTPTVFHQK